MSEKNNECEFLGGFLLGSVAGAVIAALLTPNNGDKNQDELINLYKSGVDKAKDLTDKTKVSLDDLKNTTQDKVKGLIKEMRESANNIANRFDNMTAKGASVLIDDEII